MWIKANLDLRPSGNGLKAITRLMSKMNTKRKRCIIIIWKVYVQWFYGNQEKYSSLKRSRKNAFLEKLIWKKQSKDVIQYQYTIGEVYSKH